MKCLTTPRGIEVNVPEEIQEDASTKFDLSQIDSAKSYYGKNGYVIFKSLYEKNVLDLIRDHWENEVKSFNGHMYRQATAEAERHSLNENGWVMNPILNLQSVNPKRFPQFRDVATNKILSADGLKTVFQALLGDKPKIVQSMYFEGNSATWEHQDSYYLDSVNIGKMSAAWIALEDITAEAGRFFVCPGSHQIDMGVQNTDTNIAENHEAYILSIVEKIKSMKLEIRAPKLNAGDVLFWNAWTIHGSLDSNDRTHSRSSITCHAIPNSDKFLQLQTRVFDLETDSVNGVEIYRPKDLAKLKNRMIFWVEANFPNQFYWLKKQAIKFVVSQKSA